MRLSSLHLCKAQIINQFQFQFQFQSQSQSQSQWNCKSKLVGLNPFQWSCSSNTLQLHSSAPSCRAIRAVISQRGVEDGSSGTGFSDPEPEPPRRKKLAVFVSGGGSNFRSIHKATLDGSVLGDIVVLVTNNPDCGGAVYARENGIPVLQFPKNKEGQGLSTNDLVVSLRKFEVDFILLAGYLKLIPVELVRNFPKRIFNIHPSLLPAFGGKGFYGLKVHKAVIASGARYSGPTIHFVDEEYDTGRILAQRVIPVQAFDTPEALAARVLQEEHSLYVDVVAALCEDRITWRDDGVPLIRSKDCPDQYN